MRIISSDRCCPKFLLFIRIMVEIRGSICFDASFPLESFQATSSFLQNNSAFSVEAYKHPNKSKLSFFYP